MNMARQLGLVSALAVSVTAAVGVWAAYDQPAAQQKLFLILLGLILALGFAWLSKNRLETIYTAMVYPPAELAVPNWPPFNGNWPLPATTVPAPAATPQK